MITGKQALEYFYDEAQNFDPEYMPYPFQDFIQLLRRSPDKGHNFLDKTLDNAIEALANDAWLSIDDDVQDAMVELAQKYKGELPHSNAFVMALSNEFTNMPAPITKYFEYVENISDGVQTVTSNVGTGIVDLSSNIGWLGKYSKYVLLGAGGIALYLTVTRLVPNFNKIAQKKLSKK